MRGGGPSILLSAQPLRPEAYSTGKLSCSSVAWWERERPCESVELLLGGMVGEREAVLSGGRERDRVSPCTTDRQGQERVYSKHSENGRRQPRHCAVSARTNKGIIMMLAPRCCCCCSLSLSFSLSLSRALTHTHTHTQPLVHVLQHLIACLIHTFSVSSSLSLSLFLSHSQTNSL